MVSKVHCPVCSKPYDTLNAKHLPFCSERCQLLDLSKWLGEEYSLPVEGQEDIEEEFDPNTFDDSALAE